MGGGELKPREQKSYMVPDRMLKPGDVPAPRDYPNLGWQVFPGWLVSLLEYNGFKRTESVTVEHNVAWASLVFSQ